MKIVFDSNVLIEFLRDPQSKRSFESHTNRPLILMSSVVVMELYAGCVAKQQQAALEAFLNPFQKASRILTPDVGAYIEAGRVLARLSREGIGKAHLRQISNDVLIATSATRAGVMVVTRNVRDFTRIARLTPVRWMTPDA